MRHRNCSDRAIAFRRHKSIGKAFEVRPVAIDYGAAASEISWFEEPTIANILRVVGRRGTLPVTVRLLDPLRPGDRKQLAREAGEEIADALGFKSPAYSPIGGEK